MDKSDTPIDKHDDTASSEIAHSPAMSTAAFVELAFRQNNAALLRFLCVRLRSIDEAQEVAQETFLRLLRLKDTSAIHYVQGYLFQAALNVARNRAEYSGRRRRRPTGDLPERQYDARTPQRILEGEKQLERMTVVLQQLPARCYQAFHLVKLEGLSVDDAAAAMHLNSRTVARLLRRALDSLQRAAER